MTMNRKTTIRAIGRRTRLKNRDVQVMLETLIEVWTEELVKGGRIEIENFAVIEILRSTQWHEQKQMVIAKHPHRSYRVKFRASRTLRSRLQTP